MVETGKGVYKFASIFKVLVLVCSLDKVGHLEVFSKTGGEL